VPQHDPSDDDPDEKTDCQIKLPRVAPLHRIDSSRQKKQHYNAEPTKNEVSEKLVSEVVA